MRRLKVVGLTLMSMFVLGLTATSASALLPDLHVSLTGGTYPVHAEATCSTCATALAQEGGSVLTGVGLKVLYLFAELSALGSYHAHFEGVKKGTKECNTAGDSKEVVLVEESVHLVFTELSPGLKVAALYLVLNPLTIECGTLHVKVKGSVLGSYGGALNSSITTFKGNLLGKLGRQSIFKYEENLGNTVEAELLSDSGTGYQPSSENVSKELTATVLGGQMIEILG